MIKLGQKVQDMIAGFQGIATGKVVYLNGCAQICITPMIGADGKVIESQYFDVSQIQLLGPGISERIKAGESDLKEVYDNSDALPITGRPGQRTGGPMSNTPPTEYRGSLMVRVRNDIERDTAKWLAKHVKVFSIRMAIYRDQIETIREELNRLMEKYRVDA